MRGKGGGGERCFPDMEPVAVRRVALFQAAIHAAITCQMNIKKCLERALQEGDAHHECIFATLG